MTAPEALARTPLFLLLLSSFLSGLGAPEADIFFGGGIAGGVARFRRFLATN
jgi:hypothetical protein